MTDIKFPGGEWYPIHKEAFAHGFRATEAMKVPGGVMIRESLKAANGNVGISMLFIPGSGIKADKSRPTEWALCLEIKNEVAE